MTNATTVTLTSGIPTAPSGTVSTLDNLIGPAGTPSAQVQSVQGVAGGTAQPISAAALPLPTGAALETGGNLASIVTKLTSLVTGTVLAAGSAIVGLFKITDGTNTAAVKAASTAPSVTDPALVVAISPNSVNANGQAAMTASAPVAIANNQQTLSVGFDTTQLFDGATGTGVTPTKTKISVAAATTTTVVALTASKKTRVLAMYLVVGAANNLNWQSHTTTSNADGVQDYAANGGIVLPFNPLGWFDTTSGEALDLVTSTSAQVGGFIITAAV